MGQFSWLDCKTGEQIVDMRPRKSYVLVPQQFGGGHIEETCYEGYGVFGGHDVYDLVADWNRHHMPPTAASKEWCKSWFGGEDGARSVILDFTTDVDDAVMQERYGKSYKREIGIVLACSDDDNANLRFPIKITHDPKAVYEWCAPSKSDPNQGWADDWDDDSWDDEDDEW